MSLRAGPACSRPSDGFSAMGWLVGICSRRMRCASWVCRCSARCRYCPCRPRPGRDRRRVAARPQPAARIASARGNRRRPAGAARTEQHLPARLPGGAGRRARGARARRPRGLFARSRFVIDEHIVELDARTTTNRSRRLSMVIGPLTRSAVDALVVQQGAPPVFDAGAEPARLGANGAGQPGPVRAVDRSRRAPACPDGLGRGVDRDVVAPMPGQLVVSNAAPLGRRAAVAFAERWRALGGDVYAPVEIDVPAKAGPGAQPDGASKADLSSWRSIPTRCASCAASCGARCRSMAPRTLNRRCRVRGVGRAAVLADLDGVRLVDMPWLVQRDSPAVMSYPRPAADAHPDLQRLYALGIDAFRLALRMSSVTRASTSTVSPGDCGSTWACRRGRTHRRAGRIAQWRGGGHRPALTAMPGSPTQQRGGAAETRALEHLQACGLTPVARNVSAKVGEIDLVLRDGDEWVFVEVRSRRNGAYGGALASIGAAKQMRIRRAAQQYLLRRFGRRAGRPAVSTWCVIEAGDARLDPRRFPADGCASV